MWGKEKEDIGCGKAAGARGALGEAGNVSTE